MPFDKLGGLDSPARFKNWYNALIHHQNAYLAPNPPWEEKDMYRLGQSEGLTAHRKVCCKDSTGTVPAVLYRYLSTFFEKLIIKKAEMRHVQTENWYENASREKLIIHEIWGGSRISGGSAQEKVTIQ